MRPACLPERFEQALALLGGQLARGGGAEQRATLARVAAQRDTFVAWCRELEDSPAPASLEQDALHPGNISSARPGAP